MDPTPVTLLDQAPSIGYSPKEKANEEKHRNSGRKDIRVYSSDPDIVIAEDESAKKHRNSLEMYGDLSSPADYSSNGENRCSICPANDFSQNETRTNSRFLNSRSVSFAPNVDPDLSVNRMSQIYDSLRMSGQFQDRQSILAYCSRSSLKIGDEDGEGNLNFFTEPDYDSTVEVTLDFLKDGESHENGDDENEDPDAFLPEEEDLGENGDKKTGIDFGTVRASYSCANDERFSICRAADFERTSMLDQFSRRSLETGMPLEMSLERASLMYHSLMLSGPIDLDAPLEKCSQRSSLLIEGSDDENSNNSEDIIMTTTNADRTTTAEAASLVKICGEDENRNPLKPKTTQETVISEVQTVPQTTTKKENPNDTFLSTKNKTLVES